MRIFFIILLFFSFKVFAAQDIYQFDSIQKQQRFDALTSQLRCLVCQNQNIAESNAALAIDLRKQVYEKIQKGENDQSIVNYLVERYGDFILYRPPFNGLTLALWLGPFLFLIAGLSYLFYYLRQSKMRE